MKKQKIIPGCSVNPNHNVNMQWRDGLGWHCPLCLEGTLAMDRNETIKQIKAALQRRSGKTWSVTGGRGTAWGWITITAPPKRCTGHAAKKPGAITDYPEDYEYQDTGKPNGNLTPTEQSELGRLLGLDGPVHHQGVSIPAGHDYWQEYLDRAEGKTPAVAGKPYWD